ncbi:hypothetical protein K1T71_003528 [Dendrolimus kikuchii]|uniref:Uncharacterized protein n=1 Tax=Dendrolimus kikuchii TaxID=765133 RepID=A0ACC1DBY4_9NEOP|nr:hypothetical protein K1T71_003528 [Dendrolimus kikuchii]
MAFKLGKCRLCLKLGDFYSIFTVDNSVQLAEMVMECARIKVYEGDGLPDKVCSDCIQKLSSAYIFKQQCERSDQELRRNYVPPPGFSITPPPPTRQSSDSAFSTHTDSSNLTKTNSFVEEKKTPIARNRKRSIESDVSQSSRQDDRLGSKRVNELRQKKPRKETYPMDSDYEDAGSNYQPETDSDESFTKQTFDCLVCPKKFTSAKSRSAHMRIHSRKDSMGTDAVVDIPKQSIVDAQDSDSKLNCEKCGKNFKLKIMLNRHSAVCDGSPSKKELTVPLEPIDHIWKTSSDYFECEICKGNYKSIEGLEKHMRIVHAAALKVPEKQEVTVTVPCNFCQKPFTDYDDFCNHFINCTERVESNNPHICPICQKAIGKRQNYFSHLRGKHFLVRSWPQYFECKKCKKKLATQELLIVHLATHVTKDDDNDDSFGDSRDNFQNNSGHGPPAISNQQNLHCKICHKEFIYKKSLQTHLDKHTPEEIAAHENSLLSDANNTGNNDTLRASDSESSGDEYESNTCDICDKDFAYRRLLIQHKKRKHNMSSGLKRANITLKDCTAKCLLCDVEMKVSSINKHNQSHITMSIKPRNVYTCGECKEQFQSCSVLANHIKIVHRLKQSTIPNMPTSSQDMEINPSDFCEVVVTKPEPLDENQSHNDFGEVPITNAAAVDLNGFTCPLCGKKMPTLISLKRHVNWHSNVGNNITKKIECFVCKETFRFQCHYKIHMREHYNDPNLDPKILTCSICNRKSKNLRAAQAHMNYHKQTRFQNKDYQCSICKRVFQDRKVYLSHMAIHYKKGESGQNTIVGHELPNTADKNFFDGTHTCNMCGKICHSETSLKHHIIWHNSKGLLYGARHECHICKLHFTNKKRMEIHVRKHYEDENGPFKCTICGVGYTDENYFKRHVKGHNFDHQSHKDRIARLRKDKVKCPICPRFFADMVKLIRHLRKTHPESKMIKEDPDAPEPIYYCCKLCAKVFYDPRRLQNHEEAHLRKPEFFKCKFCGKKTISLKNHRVHIKAHLVTKHIDNPLKCPQCDERFIRGYDLHYHLRDVHNIKETWIAERSERILDGPLKDLQCSICFKVLASKGNFERHLDYHNSLRCNYCFEYFGTHRFLQGHLAFSCEKKKLVGNTEVHAKKIKCEICYKAFHLQVKLDCHLRTQHDIKVSREASSEQKECVCDYCFRLFENEYALSNHKIYHRTIGYYGCRYCKKKFNTLTLFNKHKNHHYSQLNVDNPTKCDHCDETFVAFRDMIYHMRDVHKDDSDWLVLPKESVEENCHICKKTFINLHKHLTYHEQNKCKKCGEYFYSRVDFDNHLCTIESDDECLETANGTVVNKYEECRFCFKPVTRTCSKKAHEIIHRGSGAISCRFCVLKFKTLDAFNIHAFSHRSRKYYKKPIQCKKCGEKFVRYGPFIKHMKSVHKSTKKLHYRAQIRPEPCVVCKEDFPNLHNHYRAHLLNRCDGCQKYFTSAKLFSKHQCDEEDSDPSKVFICDENLQALINSYVPKDLKDDEKFYGHDEDSEDEDELKNAGNPEMGTRPVISGVLSLFQQKDGQDAKSQDGDDMSQVSQEDSKSQISILDDRDVISLCDEDEIIVID